MKNLYPNYEKKAFIYTANIYLATISSNLCVIYWHRNGMLCLNSDYFVHVVLMPVKKE